MHGFNVKRLVSPTEPYPWDTPEFREKLATPGKFHFLRPAMIDAVATDGTTASGRPSVVFKLDLPDGTAVMVETTAGAVLMLAAAIRGWYGEPIPAGPTEAA